MHSLFDAFITLSNHHIQAARLPLPVAVAAVRVAVQQMQGARWIDVEADFNPPTLPHWVIVLPRGRSVTPDDQTARELQRKVEATATAALMGTGKDLRRRHGAA